MKMFKIHNCKIFCLFFILTKFKSITFWFGARFMYIQTYMYVILESVRFFQFFYIDSTYKRCTKIENFDTFYGNIHLGSNVFKPNFKSKNNKFIFCEYEK